MDKRQQIIEEALNAVTQRKRSTAALSMGVGKTFLGLRFISYHQALVLHQLRVLVVAPKLTIFKTWEEEAVKFNMAELLTDMTFTTYLSLHKLDPSHYDIVIMDECHSLKYSHQPFLANFKGITLGLTGTPPRYGRSEKGQMVQQFCPVAYTYITDDAVEDKILNDYRIYVHLVQLSSSMNLKVNLKAQQFTTSEQKNYDYWTKRLHEAPSKKMEQIASVMRMRAMMDYTSKEHYAAHLMGTIEEKCLLFCNTQDQADKLCEHSYHSNNEFSDLHLDAFKKGRILQLSCVSQLNEGVTIPGLRAGVIMHAYGNERKSAQRIGRLLRLNPDDVATVHILCYQDTVDERWVKEALKDLDQEKIKYLQVTKTA
jgi:superfamily II DNA or RNA helicase